MKTLALSTLASLLIAPPPAQGADPVYRGSEGELAVDLPRIETAEVHIDGSLDEEVWRRAATLTGFTQAEPTEGAPASETTEVRVFYTPQALYVGVRASVSDPSRLRATLADRDRIGADDQIQILLDTFNDQRRAYAFSVNPLGIQQDGIHSEGGGGRRGDRVDLSPDFIWESRGRVGPEGYTVELRIPLKSLKFPTGKSQSWGINVVRRIAATGAEEAWAPLSRGNPSRLAQSGHLVGIRDLRPGTLLEFNPTAIGKREGSVREGEFRHDDFQSDFGGNLKWGVTSNLTLDATINPDFSQIEADAGQITVNERFAISFPEKRPFFLEGADLFATPEPLVYTRSIVDPIVGAKLTGKIGDFSVGYLGAVDESPLGTGAFGFSPDPGRAIFNIARLQRDVGAGSSVGALLTDREAGGEWNRVAGVDGRIRFGGIYTWQFQGAGSWTGEWVPSPAGTDTARVGGEAVAVARTERWGHLAQTSLDRTGRRWGFRLQVKDIPDAFRARSGFIRRVGVTDFFAVTRLSFFGEPGALLESWGPFLSANRIYGGRNFWDGAGAEEGQASLRMNFNLRGNNRVQLAASNRFFVLDAERYDRYRFIETDGDTLPGSAGVDGARELRGLRGVSLEAGSDYFRTVSLEATAGWEETPIFAEGSRGEAWSAEGEVGFRPTDALRVEGSLRHVRIFRDADGSLYSRATLPRIRAEYQLSRSVLLRATGQYSVEEVDLLRAPGGVPFLLDGVPLRIRGGRTGREGDPQINPLRLDLLFSYQPSPGTVVFLGYAREMTDRGAYQFSPLEPRADGLFAKFSYLFRS